MGSGMYSQNHKSFHKRNGNPAASPSANKIFLPILCRLSVKDSIAPHPRSINDPSSPKVSCMGQVKRHHHDHHRHLTPSSATAVKQYRNKCDQRRRRRRQLPTTKLSSSNSSSSNGHENKCGAVVPVLNLAELDPPLPVIKKLPPPQPSVNLWKRRSREDGQLTNIQIPTFLSTCSIQSSLQLEPPTSV